MGASVSEAAADEGGCDRSGREAPGPPTMGCATEHAGEAVRITPPLTMLSIGGDRLKYRREELSACELLSASVSGLRGFDDFTSPPVIASGLPHARSRR